MQLLSKLNLSYYAGIAIGVSAAILGFYGARNLGWYVDPQSPEGITITYIVIMYVLISVPGGLGLHNRFIKNMKPANQETKKKKYLRYSTLRNVFISIGFVVSIFCFYLLQYKTLIFCAGISAVGIYFCKPTQAKIQYELSLSDKDEK